MTLAPLSLLTRPVAVMVPLLCQVLLCVLMVAAAEPLEPPVTSKPTNGPRLRREPPPLNDRTRPGATTVSSPPPSVMIKQPPPADEPTVPTTRAPNPRRAPRPNNRGPTKAPSTNCNSYLTCATALPITEGVTFASAACVTDSSPTVSIANCNGRFGGTVPGTWFDYTPNTLATTCTATVRITTTSVGLLAVFAVPCATSFSAAQCFPVATAYWLTKNLVWTATANVVYHIFVYDGGESFTLHTSCV